MRLLSLWGTEVRLHLGVLLLLLFSCLLGGAPGLCLAFCLAALHEAAHWLAARALGVYVESVELAPFGGVAFMPGLSDRPGAEALVALAGPGCNLLLAMAACLLCRLAPALSGPLSNFVALNLCLCLFNLLPALPLDGGRLLRAGLSHLIGERAAGRVAAALGIALGLLLAGGGAALYFLAGRVNLTLLVSGAYMALCACRALRARPFDGARRLLRLQKQSLSGRVLPVTVLAAPEGTPPETLLADFKPGRLHRVVFLDEELRPVSAAWQGEIVRQALETDGKEKAEPTFHLTDAVSPWYS